MRIILAITCIATIAGAAAVRVTAQAKPTVRTTAATSTTFQGRVISKVGKPVQSAEVDVNGTRVRTDLAGVFRVAVPHARRYVVNIRRRGFGLVSHVATEGMSGTTWTLTEGVTRSFDPRQNILFGVSNLPCASTLSSRADWALYQPRRVPIVIDPTGTMNRESLPDPVPDAMATIERGTACSPGVTVAIPANSVIDKLGRAPAGMVDIAVTPVDVFAPYGMPGDYTVDTQSGPRSMRSFGAVTVDIGAGETSYQLRPGTKALLTIAVDPTQHQAVRGLPATVPLLYYVEHEGVWIVDGTARLDTTSRAYTATVGHFSTFNMDQVKTDQSCVRIGSAGIAGDYQLEVTIPIAGMAPVVRTMPIDNTPETIHAVYNLPSNTWIVLRPFRDPAVPLGTFVVNTGAPQVPTDPNQPAYPYGACQGAASLTDSQDPDAPVLEGFGGSGFVTLAWAYSWPGLAGSTDGFIVEEFRSNDPSPSWTAMNNDEVPGTNTAAGDVPDRAPFRTVTFPRAPGQYMYRVQALNAGVLSSVGNVITVKVTGVGTPSLQIFNSLTDVGGPTVLRFRVASSMNALFSDPTTELLEPDNYCGDVPGRSIDPGQSQTVNVGDLSPNYFFFIGLGLWQHDQQLGCAPGKWEKKNWALDTNGYPVWLYCAVQVSGHTAGVISADLRYDNNNITVNGIPASCVAASVDPIQ